MKRFSIQVFVALIAFVFGIAIFNGWHLWRNAKRTAPVPQKVLDTNSKAELRFTEIVPLLQEHNLVAYYSPGNEIEEADARLFAPIAGETIYLQALTPSEDSEDIKPRFWLRVEDYSSSELAEKRANEYKSVNFNKRIAQALGDRTDSTVIAKSSLRLWAVARGKRVYALTTEVNLLTYIKLPKELKAAISKLPEV